jgi:hypothetical protein
MVSTLANASSAVRLGMSAATFVVIAVSFLLVATIHRGHPVDRDSRFTFSTGI